LLEKRSATTEKHHHKMKTDGKTKRRVIYQPKVINTRLSSSKIRSPMNKFVMSKLSDRPNTSKDHQMNFNFNKFGSITNQKKSQGNQADVTDHSILLDQPSPI